MKKLLAKIKEILRDRRNRLLFTRIVSVNAAIVVFVTTYALVLPAITMESEAACGIPAHQHDDSCYEEVLTCDLPESDGHTHDESCYTVTEKLVCGLEEHVHSPENGCYDEEGNLICELQEHAHTDDCYKEEKTLTCGLEESEGHHHDASCYDKVLTCGLEVHVHSAECYQEDVESSAVAASTGAASVEIGNDGTGADDESPTENTNADVIADENTASSDAAMTENVNTEANAADPDITEESSAAATTGVLPEPIAEEELSEGYVPTLDMLNMDAVLTNKTGVYYYHAEDNEQIPANSEEIDSWKKFKENDSEALAPADLVRAYFAYTIPAGSLNETNQIARYRLPSNLHLTDDQIIAINQNENGIASQFINYDTLEITDTDKYDLYRGAEAVEGTRTPDQTLADDAQEYISAVVKAENVYDEEGLYGEKGAYLGQDLIFIFTPYTIEKNQNTYDSEGNPTSAGQKVTGWFACDFNMDQIDWVEEETSVSEVTAEPETDAETETEAAAEPETEIENAAETGADLANTPGSIYTSIEKSAEIIFAAQDDVLNIKEISQTLRLVETIENPVEAAEDAADEAADETADEAAAEEAAPEENIADDASSDETTEETTAEETASAAAEDDLTTDNEQPETAATDAATDADAKEKTEEPEYKSGTLKATGADYTITLDYTPDACIPENAELQIREITKETDPEAYEACLKQAKEQVVDPDADGHTDVDQEASRFFDIEIIERIIEKTDVVEDAGEIATDNTAIENAGPAHTEDAENTTENADPKHTVEAENTTDADNDTATDTDTENTEATEIETENTEAAEAGTENIGDSIRKIEPKAPVTVNIQLSNKADTKTDTTNADKSTSDQETVSGPSDPTVLHFASEGTEQIESTVGNAEKNEEDKTVDIQFEAESFSIYGVVYTVDFHWEVDGKVFEYSLAGGDTISLKALVEALQVLDEEANVDAFMENIADVTFTDESLVKVAQIKESITAGALKQKYELICEYAAQLNDTQIEEMNAKIFYPIDWALISLKAFDTEEKLSIIMKDGEQFDIVVTDAQISTDFLTAKGENYTITVTYDDAAQIPCGAKLEVREILEDTNEYKKYLSDSANELSVETGDISFARFFDIEIKDGAEKIEPKVPVQVKIGYKDALETSVTDSLNIVHFGEKKTDIISDLTISADGKEVVYEQDGFSVTGTVITPNPGNEYMVLVKTRIEEEDVYCIVNNDGSLTPVNNVDLNPDGSVKNVYVTDPMLWTYKDSHLYHNYDALHYNELKAADAYYYRYMNPADASGITTENSSNTRVTGYHYEWQGPMRVQVPDVGRDLYNSTRISYDPSNHLLKNGSNYVGVTVDADGVPRLTGQNSAQNAAEVYFAQASKVKAPVTSNNAVGHIDISIVGKSVVDIPLAYGKYYDGPSGNLVMTVSEDHKVNIEASSDVDITVDDMKRATITAYQIDSDGSVVPVDDAFYITGYSRNNPTEFGDKQPQVRMEGSFLTARAMHGEDLNAFDSATGTYKNRLDNRVYYTVQVTKPVTFNLKDENGTQLYDEDGEAMKVTVDVTMAASFNYWDGANNCPPVQEQIPWYGGGYWPNYDGHAEWLKGGYPGQFADISGMDFILGGDAEAIGSKIVALEITKFLVDENGNRIKLPENESITNSFNIYHNASGNPNSVVGLNINEYSVPANYAGYSPLHSKNIKVGHDGMGLVYDYDVTAGMYYIQEDKGSIKESFVDVHGDTWNYVGTRIETEYPWRDQPNYNKDDVHVSNTYAKGESEDLNSIPDVLGPYNDINGKTTYYNETTGKEEILRNGFLEFFVYNIYEPEKAEVKVKKEWENGTAPEGASVDVVLKRYKLVPDGSITPPEPTTADLTINDSFSGLSGDRHYSASYHVTGPDGFDHTYQWTGEPIIIRDADYGQYTVVKTASAQEGYDAENLTEEQTVTLGVAGAGVTFAGTTYTRQNTSAQYYHVLVFSSDTLNQGTEHIADNGHYAWVDADYPAGTVLNFSVGVPAWNNNSTYSYSVNGGTIVTIPKGQTKSQTITVDRDITIVINGSTPYYSQWLDPVPSVTVVSTPNRGRMMMVAKKASLRAATAYVLTNSGNNPQLEGYSWQEDTTWYNGEGLTVHLPDEGRWEKVVGDLEKKDSYDNIYVYYIDSVTENGMPSGMTAQITMDGDNKLFVYGNHADEGSTNHNDTLKIKNILATGIDITIAKVIQGTTTPLTGAEFTIRKYEDSTHRNEIKNDEYPIIQSVDEAGKILLSDLGIGYYKIEESGTPAGYVKAFEDPFFEVRRNTASGEIEVVFTNTQMMTYANGTFTVQNEPGAALPNTGGPGTRIFTILGSILILEAGVLLWRRRRLI